MIRIVLILVLTVTESTIKKQITGGLPNGPIENRAKP